MALSFSTLRRLRTLIPTLNRRSLPSKTQSSDVRLVDKKTIVPPKPLVNSVRSPSSGVVKSSSNRIANLFRSNLISDLFANHSRLLTDVDENKSIISSNLSSANRSRSLTDVTGVVENKSIRPVETLQSGSLSQEVENKTIISSDPLAKAAGLPSPETLPSNHFIQWGAKTTSELCASYMRSLSRAESLSCNNSSDPFANVELFRDNTFRPVETIETGFILHCWGETVSEDIEYATAYTKTFINYVLLSESLYRAVYKAFDVISNYSIFETSSIDTKLKILSTVFDRIQKNGQADACEVYLMNAFLRSMSNDDSKKDITKDEVMSRVIHVFQSYHKVGHHKVTEETRFEEDLGFLCDDDFTTVRTALYLEFRLRVPTLASCKEIVDFYYDNRMKRMDFEQFRAINIGGKLFSPN